MRRSGFLGIHLVQCIGIQTAGGLCHIHTHEAHHGTVFVFGGRLHGFGLCLYHVCGCHVGVAEDSGLLQLLDHCLVFGGSGRGVDTNRDHADAANIAPLCGECLIHGICHFGGMPGQSRVADTSSGDFCEGRLQSGNKFRL